MRDVPHLFSMMAGYIFWHEKYTLCGLLFTVINSVIVKEGLAFFWIQYLQQRKWNNVDYIHIHIVIFNDKYIA